MYVLDSMQVECEVEDVRASVWENYVCVGYIYWGGIDGRLP